MFLPGNEVGFDSAIALLFFSFGDLADRSNEQERGKSFYFIADLIKIVLTFIPFTVVLFESFSLV